MIAEIPSMTNPQVHKYLYELGKRYKGMGVAMELGSWLGSSACPLLEGLKESGYNKPFWSFDRWNANSEQIERLFSEGMKIGLGEDLKPYFLENIGQVYENVKAIKGNLPMTLKEFNGEPIEICIFDAPKQEPIFTGCVRALSKYWIPGVTVLGLLDYWFFKRHEGKRRKWFLAPHNFMGKYGDHFTLLKDFGENGDYTEVFFRYEKELVF